MTDIVCPSCQARYRLPEGTIGEKGRRVSCSACGHTWHAYPEPDERPLVLGPEVASEPPAGPAAGPVPEPGRPRAVEPPSEEATGDPFAGRPDEAGYRPRAEEEDRGMAAYEAFAREQEEDEDERDEAGEAAPDRIAPGPGASGRHEELADDRAKQMAQIRSMLDEIKGPPEETAPGAAPAAEPEPERPAHLEEETSEEEQARRPSAVERSLHEVEEEERDPLRARLDQYEKPRGSGDVGRARSRMLKQHAKKVRRRKLDEKRGSGTFLTGFLLVVFVVSAMAAIYLLNPLIVERFPETEPAMRDYVETMDAFRVWVAEQVNTARSWVEEMLAEL